MCIRDRVRKQLADYVLQRADGCNNTTELISMVQEVAQWASTQISMDEANRIFHDAWKQLDEAEVLERAVVPDAYRSELNQQAQEIRKGLQEDVVELERQGQNWMPGWRANPAIAVEPRHRRLLPYQDEHIAARLQEYRNLVQR